MEGSERAGREHQHVRALFAGLLAAAVALAVSACGSSNSASTTAAAQNTAPTTTSSGASTGSTTQTTIASQTTTAASSVTASAAVPRCTAAMLELSYLGGQGATCHGLLGFEVRNTSSSSCHTFGYPGVLFLDRSGQPLPTNSTRTTHDFFGDIPEVALVLAPGESASFRLGVTHGMTSTAGCTTAYGLQVIAPDDTATLRTSVLNGGAYECGTATVSPLRPGTSAYP